jgi:hypothetical protein
MNGPSEPESLEPSKLLGRVRKGPDETLRVGKSGGINNTVFGGVCVTCFMNDEIARTQNFAGVVKGNKLGKICAASIWA